MKCFTFSKIKMLLLGLMGFLVFPHAPPPALLTVACARRAPAAPATAIPPGRRRRAQCCRREDAVAAREEGKRASRAEVRYPPLPPLLSEKNMMPKVCTGVLLLPLYPVCFFGGFWGSLYFRPRHSPWRRRPRRARCPPYDEALSDHDSV
jgi:hypothetical protein